MPSYTYHTVDVFTDRLFGGNQLAVFTDAQGLDTRHMQLIARELNLSETTFVFPPKDPRNTCSVRIFTPGAELPFAGHPTLGTAHVLLTTGYAPWESGAGKVVLEEQVGPIPVSVEQRHGEKTFAQFSAAQMPETGPPPPPADVLADLLGLDTHQVQPDEPIEAVSCGVPYLFVPLTGLNAMRDIQIDATIFRDTLSDYWAGAVLAWTYETVDENVDVHARMFAPLIGIAEDPATGSAAAALAGYFGSRPSQGTAKLSWRIEQGLEMGRPSVLEVEADKTETEIVAVRVGGSTISVSSATMRLPDTE